MASDLTNPLAIFPMVEEGEATGRVAGVYARLLEEMPFVPSLFKSLAVCPAYLVLAAEQAEGVLRGRDFRTVSDELAASVRTASTPPEDQQVRASLARFVGPLGRMLLLSAGLLRALAGEVPAPAAPGRAPVPGVVAPRDPAPSQWDAPAAAVYGDIRAALDTPIVNSIWRALEGEGRLEAAWRHLGPQARGTRAAADGLQEQALADVDRIRWPVVADRAALESARVADATPGIEAILDAYVKTLPRVLVLVVSSAEH